MSQFLPPLRFVGAHVLRDGEMQARSLAVEDGVIAKGPLPEVDLRGYLILPGMVDLRARALRRGITDLPGAVGGLDRAAASFGITTLWSAQDWSWSGGPAAPDEASAVAKALTQACGLTGTDLRLQLVCDVHMIDSASRLRDLVRRQRIGQVLFTDRLTPFLARDTTQGAEIARQAATLGIAPEAHLATLRDLVKRQRDVPRFLCHVAEEFDRLGVAYGSLGDGDGETREMYSMIGAKLCVQPRVRAAAALARAVCDPVILSARDVIAAPGTPPGFAVLDAIRAGLCSALCSDGGFAALAQSAFAAADRAGLGLPRAWDLVSRNPAELMRLPDRGVIDYGRRADLVIVDAASRRVEATIAAGRLTYLSGEAANRFMGAPAARDLAAE